MNKFQKADSSIPVSRAEFRKAIIASGGTKAEADKSYREIKNVETWLNDEYVVTVNRDAINGFQIDGGMFELSIRRQDRGPIRDWRKVQQIKNEIIGTEHEAVELYPAESRLRDSANHYWLYGFNDKDARFPFGMWGRAVDDKQFLNSKQRGLNNE